MEGIPFYDMVVLTAADKDQADAFQKQVDDKMDRGHLPLGVPYHVFSDPPGPKVGESNNNKAK